MSSEPSKPAGQSSTPLAVNLEGITKRFPGVLANDDVDLTVERGTVHALLGENGAGKTTLMNVLYGLYRPTAGHIRLNGEQRTFISGRMTSCSTAAATYFGVGFCYDPIEMYTYLFVGGMTQELGITLQHTTVLVSTGLSVALAFRAGVFNIGTQGQLIAGGLGSSLLVLWVASVVPSLSHWLLLIPIGLFGGAVCGGLYGAIPGVLKAYADANEVITTIMLNIIAAGIAQYLIFNHFREPDSEIVKTETLPSAGRFPMILFENISLIALFLAIAVAVGVYYLLRWTTFGYDLRTAGLQETGAVYGGVRVRRTIVATLTLSGALGGVGGAVYVMLIQGYFHTGVAGFGFDGIAVAILAGNNPLGVPFAGALFGVIKGGSNINGPTTDVPPSLVGVLRGLIILFVAMPEFFRLFGGRLIGEGSQPQPSGTGPGGDSDE